MIVDYGSLQAQIRKYLARDDLEAQIPTFIQFAEKRINRTCRIRHMEANFFDAISSGVIPVPTNYVGMKFARVGGQPMTPLEHVGLQELYSEYPHRVATGKPKVFTRETNSLIFGPYPDSDYVILGTYYRAPDPMVNDVDAPWTIVHAPDMILYASLVEAEPFMMNDSRIILWEQKYQAAKKELEDDDHKEAYSGSAPVTRIV